MKRYLVFAIKLTLAALLLRVVSDFLDWRACRELLYTTRGILALGISIVIILLQYIIAGSKLWYLSKNTKTAITLRDAVRSQFMSNFITQFGFSFASGDVARIIYLHNRYNKLADVSIAILTDRITGFIALSVLYFLCLMEMRNLLADTNTLVGLYCLGLLCLILIVGYSGLLYLSFEFKHRFLQPLNKFIQHSRKLLQANKNIFPIMLISFTVCALNVIVFAICGNIFGADLSLYTYFIISVPAILISMIPISIAGWGVRESAFIAGFALLSNDGELGLIISLTFGVASLFASLPGIFLIDWEIPSFVKQSIKAN